MANRPRRLSVILHADLAGYVRLMEGSEDRTVDRLQAVRAEVWRPALEIGGGSVVNIEGDSVLAEFGSALAAVATAIDIQERMASFNGMLEADQRLMFRIGLHLGEVIVDDRTATITRANWFERLWTRATGDFGFMELCEFSFSDEVTL